MRRGPEPCPIPCANCRWYATFVTQSTTAVRSSSRDHSSKGETDRAVRPDEDRETFGCQRPREVSGLGRVVEPDPDALIQRVPMDDLDTGHAGQTLPDLGAPALPAIRTCRDSRRPAGSFAPFGQPAG